MDFEKIQVSISLLSSSLLQSINMINIEIGCINSMGEVIWKSLARIKENNDFRKISYNGNLQDILEQATWKEFSSNKTYVFDFSNTSANELLIKQTISKKIDNTIEASEFKVDINKKEHHTDFYTLKITILEI